MNRIPKTLKIYDNHIAKTMTMQFVAKINDVLFMYENIKTGCKQCFGVHELKEICKEMKKC